MSTHLPINVLELLRQRTVESERIEYKAGWNPDPIVRTICAFANDFENLGGGYIIIGQDCDDNGKPIFPPVGLAETELDKIQRELQTVCNLIEPRYFPKLSVETIEGRKLIVLYVPGGQNRPYKAPANVTAKHKNRHYFIRRYTSTVEAIGEIEQELLHLTAKVPFDDQLHPTASAHDLSQTIMQGFLQDVGSKLAEDAPAMPLETLGRQMNVIGGASEAPRIKNVGLLFFNDAPEQYFPGTQIDVVWFPDGPGGDWLDEKTFKGPLARMAHEALDHIKRNFLREMVIKYPDRAESRRVANFPYPAVEEALMNALYHRSYQEPEPIEVRISPEELIVLSFPGPDRSISLESLQSGRAVSRRYRNRRIGDFLKELDLTEGRATGIPKILKTMAQNGSPAPIFETDDERISFVIRLPVQPVFLRVQPSHQNPLLRGSDQADQSSLLGQSGQTEQAGATASPAPRRWIDISRIDKYVPTQVIGRNSELKLLSDAWASAIQGEPQRPRILAFVAFGGEGKTALVAKWLADMATQNWPSCEFVFAWSFYSQGSHAHQSHDTDLFFNQALLAMGEAAMADGACSAQDKGRRLAELFGARRGLLVLDGLEPLQTAPTAALAGELQDPGLTALLKGLAVQNRGLCILTTRYSISNLKPFWNNTVQEYALPRLSDAAGAELLQTLGVHGSDDELTGVVAKVAGHALTLNLIGTYLRDAYGGDIRQYPGVDWLEADRDEHNGHAFRIIETYADWLAQDGEKGLRALGLLQLMGLFDRPASAACLDALLAPPAIPGLSPQLAGSTQAQRNLALARLESAKLLTLQRHPDGALLAVDAHPLLRDYFARQLRTQQPQAWQELQQRLATRAACR